MLRNGCLSKCVLKPIVRGDDRLQFGPKLDSRCHGTGRDLFGLFSIVGFKRTGAGSPPNEEPDRPRGKHRNRFLYFALLEISNKNWTNLNCFQQGQNPDSPSN